MQQQYSISKEQFLEVLRYTHYAKPANSLKQSKNFHIILSVNLIVLSIIIFFLAPTVMPSIMLFSMALFSALTASFNYYQFIKLMQEWEAWEKSCNEIEDLNLSYK